MPRPGPRPYECVRRAWHSDRHQPIRGSIIQQIFRVVNGRHSTATQGNREWQEKLPIVVFKAEEIMYSKANSENEYTDLETLWDRVNEAINIIIRRDESMETGDLLPPCVEAALNLGCVPVRASRSQRHSNPRTYLGPRNQDSVSLAPKVLETPTHGRVSTSQRSLHYGNQSIEERPGTVNLSNLRADSNVCITQNNSSEPTTSGKFASAYEKFPSPRKKQFVSMEGDTSMNLGRVYPLHSGTHFQPGVSGSGFRSSSTIIDGTPVYPSVTEPAERGCLKNLFSSREDDNTLSRIAHVDSGDKQPHTFEQTGCDLSLRLGLFSDPRLNRGKGSASDIDIVGVRNSQEEGQLNSLISTENKEFSFFPTGTANDAFELSTSTRNREGEVQNAEAANRKRSNVDDGQIFWQPESTSDYFSNRKRWPGL